MLTHSLTLLSRCFARSLPFCTEQVLLLNRLHAARVFPRAVRVKLTSTGAYERAAALYVQYLAFVCAEFQPIGEYFLNIFGNYIVID